MGKMPGQMPEGGLSRGREKPDDESEVKTSTGDGESGSKKDDKQETNAEKKERLEKALGELLKASGKNLKELAKQQEKATPESAKKAAKEFQESQIEIEKIARESGLELYEPLMRALVGSSVVEIYKKSDGGYVMTGFAGYDSATLHKFFSEAGIKIALPKDFDDWASNRKVEYLRGQGVVVTQLFGQEAGGAEPTGARRVVEPVAERGRSQPLTELLPDLARVETIINKLMGVTALEGAETMDGLRNQLQGIINQAKGDAESNRNYKFVYEVSRAITGAEAIYKGMGQGDAFNALFAEGDTRLFTSSMLLRRMDTHFQNLWRGLTNVQRAAIAGDIDEIANAMLAGIHSNWRSIDEARTYVIPRIGIERPGPPGLREWRGVQDLQGLEAANLKIQQTTLPAAQADIAENLATIFHDVEATGLSVDDLEPKIRQARGLIEGMLTNSVEAREKREELIKQLESFRAMHAFLITLERTDMNPDEAAKVISGYFEGKKEVTLEDFLARFDSDQKGRKFWLTRDKNGVLTEARKINVFDVEFKLYADKLRDERIMMNMIEEMTKHAIGRQFNASEIAEMKRNVGFDNLSAEWKGKWEGELETLRQYFVRKLQEGNHSLDVWGQRKTERDFTVMRNLISGWHRKKTLHGAFETVMESDLVDLAREFRMPFVIKPDGKPKEDTDEERSQWRAIRERFLDKQFLTVRRNQMVDGLRGELENRGLKIGDIGNLADPDFDDLRQSGYLESVDHNAYNFAWFMMWSNYDNIRIYNRHKRSQYHDDYDDIVFHSSTAMFNARAIDHTWEFYHRENENRGRAKENETDVIFKQFLPGKHHYLFPQNTMMVRWAHYFMTPKQFSDVKSVVKTRIAEMQNKYDFHNDTYKNEFESWMQSVVIMDMIENGEFSLGNEKDGDEFGYGLSVVAKQKLLKKFEFLDVYGDRGKNLQYGNAQNFQSYLANPTEEKFLDLNAKEKNFYSARSARQFPWMTLAMRAHWEIVNHHSMRLFDRQNVQSEQMERTVSRLITSGFVEKEQGVDFKRKNLGFIRISPQGNQDDLPTVEPVVNVVPSILLGGWARKVRQFLENSRRAAWESRVSPLAFLLGLIAEIVKRLPGQTFEEKR